MREILQGSFIVLRNTGSSTVPAWRFVSTPPAEVVLPAELTLTTQATDESLSLLPLDQQAVQAVVSTVNQADASGAKSDVINNEMIVTKSATEASSAKKRKYSKAVGVSLDQEDELDETAMRIRVLDKYERLINDPEFSDVRIIVEGKTFHAHKAVLARSSTKFKAIFRNIAAIGDNKKESSKVEIEDVKYDVFTELLRFLYVGRVFNIENIVGELLHAADDYRLDDLKLVCEKYLNDNLIVDNALEILKLAQTYQLDRLKDKTIKFVALYADRFIDDPEFKSLSARVLYKVCRAIVKKSK